MISVMLSTPFVLPTVSTWFYGREMLIRSESAR